MNKMSFYKPILKYPVSSCVNLVDFVYIHIVLLNQYTLTWNIITSYSLTEKAIRTP